MNEKESKLVGKVRYSMYQQVSKGGVVVPVQVLMDVGMLTKKDYEEWRFGRVDYLERVCRGNLRRISGVMREVRLQAQKHGLKPSWTCYKQWGCKGGGPPKKLRFSKYGKEKIERAYATHYVDACRIKKAPKKTVTKVEAATLQQDKNGAIESVDQAG